jgi:N-acetylmuramoyl-L-alanine amidase
MHKLLYHFLLIATLSGFAVHAQALEVMIDPGHGGIDSGTFHSGIQEKDLVLKVAGYLKTLLADNPQFSVQMTREKDQHLSLPERVKKAEKAQADLFISLHANSNPDRRVKGTELYFQNSLPPDEESLMLADQENQAERPGAEGKGPAAAMEAPPKKGDIMAIVEDLHRQYRAKSSLKMTQLLSIDWPHSAIRQAPFYVVSKTSMPSVLVEVGFLSHPEESKKLNTPKYQQEIAQKIYKAILQYKEMMDKIEGQALE